MTRDTSCNQMRHITFIWTLDSVLTHHAIHQSTRYHTVVRSKACGTVTMRGWVRAGHRTLCWVRSLCLSFFVCGPLSPIFTRTDIESEGGIYVYVQVNETAEQSRAPIIKNISIICTAVYRFFLVVVVAFFFFFFCFFPPSPPSPRRFQA